MASEAEEFGRRLRQALKQAGLEMGAVTLAATFNIRFRGRSVTRQAVQKWLNGENMPVQAKLQVLAELLQVPPDWLRYGKGNAGVPSALHQALRPYQEERSDDELLSRFHKLNERQQQAIFEIITALSGKPLRR